MLTQAPRGTHDVLPVDSAAWQWIEEIEREVCKKHGIHEIRTPAFEHTELFLRGVGDTTDVVQKEMYTFLDKGERSITLKPEGTAGVVRAFIEHGLFNDPMPCKVFYVNCPVFRYEAPQSGRLREHHQFGVEVFGAPQPSMDAQIISIAMEIIGRIGLNKLSLNINSIGCPKCRPAYQQRLKEHFAPSLSHMCDSCKDRYERNPLRLIDCKEESCQPFKANAPRMIDCLCEDCQGHFDGLKTALELLDLPYQLDPGIVRGLDYYTRTVFEIIAHLDSGDITACGGGRLDGLVETIGGPSTPAFGFGMGTERLLMAAVEQGISLPASNIADVYIASFGEEARLEAFALAAKLRREGLCAESDQVGRSMKAQFKYAGKLKVPFVATLGPDEIAQGQVRLRDMGKGEEQLLPREELLGYLLQHKGEKTHE